MRTIIAGRFAAATAVLVALAGSGGCADAQTPMAGDSIHAAKTLFTWRDGVLAAGFTGLTIAMFPADRSLAKHLQDSSTQANRFLKNASKGIQYFADPGSVVIGVSLYGVGRLAHWRDVADLGLHGTEAIALSGVVTTIIKDAAGRARPYVSADTSPHDFGFGRGLHRGSGYQSFPSGHATAAFAAASVVTSESQRWWPQGIWLVAPAMYGGATLVGLSRMYNNAHWASDVVVGAAIGTFSGIKVVRYSHGHTNNFVDRWLLGVQAMPAPDGRVGLGWSMSY
ncbi:MAG: phosphoesterase PA-phosphatase related protein [Gemmatimonadetes bacterium]|nr:phosphoesterase PA-phosphatase related protein [Gemmatimonadota bacterium]